MSEFVLWYQTCVLWWTEQSVLWKTSFGSWFTTTAPSFPSPRYSHDSLKTELCPLANETSGKQNKVSSGKRHLGDGLQPLHHPYHLRDILIMSRFVLWYQTFFFWQLEHCLLVNRTKCSLENFFWGMVYNHCTILSISEIFSWCQVPDGGWGSFRWS